MSRSAVTDRPIHSLVRDRWNPPAYSHRPVPPEDLASICEAARWAASSFNEQPWRYIVASRDSPDRFAAILDCLVEGNRAWARHAAILALGCARSRFTRNDKPNQVAQRYLGLASATSTLKP